MNRLAGRLLIAALLAVAAGPGLAPGADLVIYGGTAGGAAAAVQARRLGRTVVLIEPGRHLGGMTSGGLGATDIGNKRVIGGVSREFYRDVARHYAADSAWTCARAWRIAAIRAPPAKRV